MSAEHVCEVCGHVDFAHADHGGCAYGGCGCRRVNYGHGWLAPTSAHCDVALRNELRVFAEQQEVLARRENACAAFDSDDSRVWSASANRRTELATRLRQLIGDGDGEGWLCGEEEDVS